MSAGGVVRERVVEITNHIKNDSVKSRVQRELFGFLNDLDLIGSLCDDLPLKKDGDGIPVLSAKEWTERENHKLNELKAANVFPASAVVVMPISEENDINARGQFGYTKLIQAVVNNDVALVKELLMNPAVDREIKDNSGARAIDKASNRGYEDIIALFETM